MKLAVIGGAGYVGLITAVGFARLGNDVVAADVNQSVVDKLKDGVSPIHEEGLTDALAQAIAAGRIRFTTNIAEGVADAEVVFIAVGTPPHEDGSPDLSALRQVALALANLVAPGTVVAIKSTVPVGTVSEMQEAFRSMNNDHAEIVCNPEFLSEGTALHDFYRPSRIVVGVNAAPAARVMRQLYLPFIESGPEEIVEGVRINRSVPYVETGIEEAQIIKYASNAYLAARVSFVNEIASICEHLGADIRDVTHGLGMDPRIGKAYLAPGIGFGGPCLEKDLKALTFSAAIHGYRASFLEAALQRNDEQINHVVNGVLAMCSGGVSGKRIAALGLAFKAGTNDVRTSLSLRIIDRLLNLGAEVAIHDPVAMREASGLLPLARPAIDAYDAAAGADLLLLLTDWPEYKALDWPRIAGLLKSKQVFDGRNALDAGAVAAAGLGYRGIGTRSRIGQR